MDWYTKPKPQGKGHIPETSKENCSALNCNMIVQCLTTHYIKQDAVRSVYVC